MQIYLVINHNLDRKRLGLTSMAIMKGKASNHATGTYTLA